MAKMSKISNELLPYKAGFAIVTKLNENMLPDINNAVRTSPRFLTSTQYTEGQASEDVATGDGSTASYPTTRTDTFAITTNSFSPIFHNMVTGKREYLPDKALSTVQIEANLPAKPSDNAVTTVDLKFGTGTDYPLEPAKDEYGNYRFVVQDRLGNYLTQHTTAMLGTYVYDPDTKTMSFSADDYHDMLIRVTYDYEDTEATVYESSPILKKNIFRVETVGFVQDATTFDVFKVKRELKRCTLTGDIPAQPTQTSKSATLTYTFTSEPMPEGVAPFKEVWTKYTAGSGVTDTDAANIVNGCDDNFTTSD